MREAMRGASSRQDNMDDIMHMHLSGQRRRHMQANQGEGDTNLVLASAGEGPQMSLGTPRLHQKRRWVIFSTTSAKCPCDKWLYLRTMDMLW